MATSSLKRILALAVRIFRQFIRDRRTAFMIFFAPLFIMTLVYFLFRGPPSKLPFALIKASEGTSMVYDVIKHSLEEEEERLVLVDLEEKDVTKALEEGLISGALVVKGGSFDDLMEGRGASLTLHLEGSDPIKSKDLAIILERMQRRLVDIIRSDLIPLMGEDSLESLKMMDMEMKFLYGGKNFDSTDYFAPIILGVFAFILTFLLTSVSFLRERNSGTMERLLVSPISRIEIMVGYMIGFAIFTLLQAGIILLFEIYVLKVYYAGNLVLIFGVVVLVTIMASNLGMFLSSYARTELQVAQFMPMVILPLILVSGVFWSIESMPKWLKPLAYASPLTWANVALRDVMIKGFGPQGIMFPMGLLFCFAVLFCLLGAATIRKQNF